MNTPPARRVEPVMARVAVALLIVALSLPAALAEADDLRRGSIIPRVGSIIPHGANIVPNPPPERFHRGPKGGHGHHHPGHRLHHQGHGHRHHGHHHHHGVRSGFVFVAPPTVVYSVPRSCVTPGYWAYQWIPTSATYSTYVPGHFGVDGGWIEGRWEQRAYASGYYQPYWVPEQTYAC